MSNRDLQTTIDRIDLLYTVMQDVLTAYDEHLPTLGSTSNHQATLAAQLLQLDLQIRTVRSRIHNLERLGRQ